MHEESALPVTEKRTPSMELLRLYAMPALLVLCACVMVAQEIRVLLQSKNRHPIRFIRRIFSASAMFWIAARLHFGHLAPHGGASPAEVIREFHYWVDVLELGLLLVVLAVWDAIESVRNLHREVEYVARKEIESLQEHLKSRS